jgi:hypothetical protein
MVWKVSIKRLTFNVSAMDILEMATKSRAKSLDLDDRITPIELLTLSSS